mmetsp:Transcript_4999/g.7638  ORF Transcript_4999/g.7638 Transcript_4999/m.7638 type:complete len:367 (+) Transcript_4999:70-1170(+)
MSNNVAIVDDVDERRQESALWVKDLTSKYTKETITFQTYESVSQLIQSGLEFVLIVYSSHLRSYREIKRHFRSCPRTCPVVILYHTFSTSDIVRACKRLSSNFYLGLYPLKNIFLRKIMYRERELRKQRGDQTSWAFTIEDDSVIQHKRAYSATATPGFSTAPPSTSTSSSGASSSGLSSESSSGSSAGSGSGSGSESSVDGLQCRSGSPEGSENSSSYGSDSSKSLSSTLSDPELLTSCLVLGVDSANSMMKVLYADSNAQNTLYDRDFKPCVPLRNLFGPATCTHMIRAVEHAVHSGNVIHALDVVIYAAEKQPISTAVSVYPIQVEFDKFSRSPAFFAMGGKVYSGSDGYPLVPKAVLIVIIR